MSDTENISKILAQNERLLKQNEKTHVSLESQGREISATHATVEGMEKRITEHRIDQRKTNKEFFEKMGDIKSDVVRVEERVDHLRSDVDGVRSDVDQVRSEAKTAASMPVVKGKDGWFLTPKQWVMVAGFFIPAVYGAVEILIKIAKYME